MDESKKKHKSIVDRLTYAYIRKIKKWMFCPNCKNGKMSIDKKSTVWTCESCGYKLSADEFEDNYVFWFCDDCESYLNVQEGFDRHASKHICRNCGYENDTTFDNIVGICTDCGKKIPDPDGTLCVDCKIARHEKAKEGLITAGAVVGTIAAAAGAATCAISQSNDDEYTPLPEGDDDESDGENENDGLKFGDSELLRIEENVRLLKIGARYDREVYCVLGGDRHTMHFEEYEDALEEFNLRWMKAKYGE